MESFAKGAGVSLFVVALVFLVIILGTLFGALAGWIVGLVFEDTIRSTMSAFGVDLSGVAMWQLGATLGFVGGFFRPTLKASGKD